MALKIAKVLNNQASVSFETLGLKAFELGDLEGASAHFLSALEAKGDDAGLYLKLGTVLLQQGKVDKALIAFKRSLELDPFDADAFNAMGSALFHLELWGPAEAFYARALELAPQHATAKGNLIEARKRLRGGDTPLPPEFDSVMALLQLKGPTLSLCMIAKNEEQFIGDCLASVRNLVDEIILVDTGSTDRTVEIAESFGAKIHRLPWQGDFAAARNASLKHATGDWILVLDADEMIPSEHHAELKRALRSQDFVGYNLIIENLLGEEGETHQTALIFRMFRNRPDIRYEGIIHEQALPSAERTGMPVQNVNARIIHRGYLDRYVNERDKHERNLAILLRQIEDEPENPYAHFNLGQTYKMKGQQEESARAYEQALGLLKAQNAPLTTAYWPHLYFSFVDLYRLMGRFDQALALADEAIEKFPSYPDILMTRGLVLLDMTRFEEAIACFEACRAYKGIIYSSGNDPSVPTYKSSQALGVAYFRMGQLAQARKYFLQALEEMDRPSKELYNNLGVTHLRLSDLPQALSFFIKTVELDDGNAQAWSNIGYICQQLGQHEEALVARQKAYEIDPEGNGFVFGTSLLHGNRYEEAETLFVRETERNPGFGAGWTYLGLVKLCLGKPEEAVVAWRTLAEAPEFDQAQRDDGKALLAFSRLIAGDSPENLEGLELSQKGGELWVLVLNHLLLATRYGEVERALAALPALRAPGLELGVGRLLLQHGLHEEAMGFLLQAREQAPDVSEIYVLLGETAEGMKNLEDAQVMYQMALSLDPKQVAIRQRLGRLRISASGK